MQGIYIAKVFMGSVLGAIALALLTLIIIPVTVDTAIMPRGDMPPVNIAVPLASLLSSIFTLPVGAFLGSFSITILIAIQQHRWKDACRLSFTSVACYLFGLLLLYAASDLKTLVGVMTLIALSVVWAAALFLTGAWSFFMSRRRKVS